MLAGHKTREKKRHFNDRDVQTLTQASRRENHVVGNLTSRAAAAALIELQKGIWVCLRIVFCLESS